MPICSAPFSPTMWCTTTSRWIRPRGSRPPWRRSTCSSTSAKGWSLRSTIWPVTARPCSRSEPTPSPCREGRHPSRSWVSSMCVTGRSLRGGTISTWDRSTPSSDWVDLPRLQAAGETRAPRTEPVLPVQPQGQRVLDGEGGLVGPAPVAETLPGADQDAVRTRWHVRVVVIVTRFVHPDALPIGRGDAVAVIGRHHRRCRGDRGHRGRRRHGGG